MNEPGDIKVPSSWRRGFRGGRENRKMTENFNKSNMKKRRQNLRNNATPAEQKLWQKLKGKQIAGIKFRRQYSIDSFIVDFYAPSCKLVVEIDGGTHFSDEAIEYDIQRERYIKKFGIRIIRFTNVDVFENIDGVLQMIEQAALEGL